jgi:glucosamine-6-phosphate deaminase
MKLYIYKNVDDLFVDLGNYYQKRIKDNPKIVLGLATGSTPLPLYKELIQHNIQKDITFKDVITINLDEYIGLDVKNNQSYRFFMNENLFNHIDILKQNTFVPNGLGDINKNALLYDKIIEEHPIDIQLLGLGSNGHIAFNEPGSSINSTTRIVELKQSTRQSNAKFFNNNVDLVPTHAVSVGFDIIKAAKKIVIIATGKDKYEAVQHLLNAKRFDTE